MDSPSGETVQSSTTYIGGVYEKHQDGSMAKYYAAMGRTIAMRTVPAAGGAGTLTWPLLDHLGSTVGMTDSAGNVVSRQDYWPYGTARSVQTYAPVTQTDKLYTGQQQEGGDAALGLYNYKARFYSTVDGAFVSADTTNDGLNRYGYVHGNPTTFADPTGHGPTNCDRCAPSPPCTGFNTAACTAPNQPTNAPTQHDRDKANCYAHPVACAAWGGDQHAQDLLRCYADPGDCQRLRTPTTTPTAVPTATNTPTSTAVPTATSTPWTPSDPATDCTPTPSMPDPCAGDPNYCSTHISDCQQSEPDSDPSCRLGDGEPGGNCVVPQPSPGNEISVPNVVPWIDTTIEAFGCASEVLGRIDPTECSPISLPDIVPWPPPGIDLTNGTPEPE